MKKLMENTKKLTEYMKKLMDTPRFRQTKILLLFQNEEISHFSFQSIKNSTHLHNSIVINDTKDDVPSAQHLGEGNLF